MSRKQPNRKAGNMAITAIAGIFFAIVVGGVGFGVASADSMDEMERAGAFGFSKVSDSAAVLSLSEVASDISEAEPAYYEQSALAYVAPRDLNAGMRMVDEMERAEQERIARENAIVLERVAAEQAQQGVAASEELVQGAAPAPEAVEYNLPAVDWSVGKEAFLAEWTARIDDYLAGSPLAGYGAVFAEAAWDNGVDPRWSPAISNTESGKGSVCFLPCNAWGWGSSSWDDWESAIRSHVAGLAAGYGYSITPEAAQAYCPPTWDEWYAKTIDQMSFI